MQKDRAIITIGVLTSIFIAFKPFGYVKGNVWEHFTYVFSHANIFHLAVNSLAVWYLFTSTKRITLAYIIAVICSFIAYSPLPTMGISSMLFALVGMNIFQYGKVKKRNVIFMTTYLIVGLFISNINGLLHILSFCCGAFISIIVTKYNGIRRDIIHITGE